MLNNIKKLNKKAISKIQFPSDLQNEIVKCYIKHGYSLHSNVYININDWSEEIVEMSIKLENDGDLFRHDEKYMTVALNENRTNKALMEIFS